MKVCFVCKKGGKILDFNDESYKKCCDYIRIRKLRRFKYGELELTAETKVNHGYHLECYKRFTSLKRKYIDENVEADTGETPACSLSLPATKRISEAKDKGSPSISCPEVADNTIKTHAATESTSASVSHEIQDAADSTDNFEDATISIIQTPACSLSLPAPKRISEAEDKGSPSISCPEVADNTIKTHAATESTRASVSHEIQDAADSTDNFEDATTSIIQTPACSLSLPATKRISEAEDKGSPSISCPEVADNTIKTHAATESTMASVSHEIQDAADSTDNFEDATISIIQTPACSLSLPATKRISEAEDKGSPSISCPEVADNTIKTHAATESTRASVSHEIQDAADSTDYFEDATTSIVQVNDDDPTSNTAGKEEKGKCIFCLQHAKRVGSRRQYVCLSTSVGVKGIIDEATHLEDTDLLERADVCDNLYYHKICRTLYHQKYEYSLDIHKETTSWHETRKIHKEAFEILTLLITQEIIGKERVYFLSDISSIYKSILSELSEHENFCQNFNNQHLETKMLKTFGNTIVIERSKTTVKRKIVYKNGMDINKLLSESTHDFGNHSKLQDVAFDLRNSIKAVEKKKLDHINPETIIEGECNIPKPLHNLISNLIQGPDRRRRQSEDDSVRINSICQDIIFCIHKGQIKPSKHLKLGFTIKTLTNSKKILTLLNRLGHSVGYQTIEELETEMTYAAYENNKIIPNGIVTNNAALSTHVAFDNFDRYVETRDGKDTLHDTVGIIYQFPPFESNSCGAENDTIHLTEHTNKKRRRFDEIPHEIIPYLKKPKAVTSLKYLENFETEILYKENAINRDLMWVFLLSQKPEDTPLWTGFISKTSIDSTSTQTLDYLPQINQSPTSYTVVHETMKMAQTIRKQCDQEFIIVTYDLAIAKMALQIQITETPKFEDIFINLGGFHIQLAFFKALGKFIDSCGIENVLIENGILAGGSMNGLISGKHFNRCRRVHGLLLAALHTLHFKTFLEETELDVAQLDVELTSFLEVKTNPLEPLTLSPFVKTFIDEYKKYVQSSEDGEHGKTAQFYMYYIKFMSIYNRFSRSIRTNDFSLLTESLFEMANIFFIFNHQNYARWILKYLQNLLKTKRENSILFLEFNKGAFGIKRTQINISRSPVDLALEQTINANAGSALTGLCHITNSIGARQRWALSHSQRAKIVLSLIDEVGMTEKEDVTSDLRQSNFDKNKQSIKDITEGITKSMNPFGKNLNEECLFNMATGRAAKEEVVNFLLNAYKDGETQKKLFIDDCNADPNRFEKPIKKNKILNFASEGVKKVQKSDKKTTKLKMERDIFGRLLAIALQKKIDMETCMSFPLAPVPPALAEYNGDMHHTQKSKLANHLKLNSDCASQSQVNEDVLLVDGFHLLRTLGTVPQTYGKISEVVLQKMCNTKARETHLIFDVYRSPSIKDPERQKRLQHRTPYNITGASQNRDANFQKSLNNVCFKEAFVEFLVKHWENDYLAGIISDKKVYLTSGETCFSYKVENDKIIKKEETTYICDHEEADTRIIFHLSKAQGTTILIRGSDTDIMIILLGNIHKFPSKEILMTTGSKEAAFSLKQIALNLGPDLCKSLPALHAFTGCDYTASFKGKGKIKPLQILKLNSSYQKAFAELNRIEDIKDIEKMKTIQKFTSELYSLKSFDDVNKARVHLFNKKYSAKTTGNFYKKIHNFDSSYIPPCWKSLKQKTLRTIYVNSMWQSATESTCIKFRAEDCGWIQTENAYEILWYEGDPTPLLVEDIIIDSSSEDEVTECSSDEES